MSRRNRDSETGTDDRTASDAERWTQVAQRYYDPENRADLTTEIIAAIADARGVDITEVTSPPLSDSVDTAALENTLFSTTLAGTPQADGRVEFRYEEHLVVVHSDGWIQVFESMLSE